MWSFYGWVFTPPLRDAKFKSMLTSRVFPQPATSPTKDWALVLQGVGNELETRQVSEQRDFSLFLFTWKVPARKRVHSFVQTWKAKRSVFQYSFRTCWNIDSFLVGIFSVINGSPDCAISFSFFHFRCDRSSIDFVGICNILNWPLLSTRRAYFSLLECYKIVFGLSHLKAYCRTF